MEVWRVGAQKVEFTPRLIGQGAPNVGPSNLCAIDLENRLHFATKLECPRHRTLWHTEQHNAFKEYASCDVAHMPL
eukprot:1155809-Pelagomonas_calceolata.AAC.1